MEFYSVKEIAELLSVNDETVRRWIRDEKLLAERGNGRQGSKVTSEALSKFLNENKGLMTTIAASTLGISSTSAVLGGAISALTAPFTIGILAGISWISILKDSEKDRKTVRIEILEKEIELENYALKLKNEIALKQNELEMIEKQIGKLHEIKNELDLRLE